MGGTRDCWAEFESATLHNEASNGRVFGDVQKNGGPTGFSWRPERVLVMPRWWHFQREKKGPSRGVRGLGTYAAKQV